eukprot:CAMPEP_0119427556 /NCGR_PEP_ID=MMETSP1335-20130426/38598_1 /TAXON_ID=259385 /ORGANISM="Chrysoculter rhomboideus, Strain RCC1486" /LENGTH=44 /DNA_ID= /DNA_START= /DNA_END= /DNA_ORIENTATION=
MGTPLRSSATSTAFGTLAEAEGSGLLYPTATAAATPDLRTVRRP